VLKSGKIGQELLGKKKTVQRANSRSTAQTFLFTARYPRSETARRLTAEELKFARDCGVSILGYQIDQDNRADSNGNKSVLDGYAMAAHIQHLRDWLQGIGVSLSKTYIAFDLQNLSAKKTTKESIRDAISTVFPHRLKDLRTF